MKRRWQVVLVGLFIAVLLLPALLIPQSARADDPTPTPVLWANYDFTIHNFGFTVPPGTLGIWTAGYGFTSQQA